MWPEREKITQATWTSPVTNRILFEAGFSSFSSKWGGYVPPGSQTGLVAVTEQSTAAGVPVPNFIYRGWNSAASNNQQHNIWRASLAYVTGAHSFKVGYQAAHEVYRQIQNVDNQLSYTFNNGTPTQFTMRIGPHIQSNRTRYDGFYVQDQWTHGRLTVQGALRYEHAWSWFPEGENGITADNRFGSRFIFPRQDGVTGFHDITPRMGAAYDRVRERQDVAEGEHQQIPGNRAERRPLHHQQSGGDVPADDERGAGPTATAISSRTAI